MRAAFWLVFQLLCAGMSGREIQVRAPADRAGAQRLITWDEVT
jgi:hypothetical protein